MPGEQPLPDSIIVNDVGAVVTQQYAALADDVLGELRSEADSVVYNATRSLIFSVLVGLWVIVLTALLLRFLYRAIKSPIERLTEQSRQIASVELPEVVAAMRRGDTDAPPEIEELVAESDDEIGELVHAFNDMHRTAIGLAAEQAGSRRIVADMFVNLGRRNQRLINRLLRRLTALEQDERDPDKLAGLYEIDHVATRMRRNAESLLVLAGAAQSRRWDHPVDVYDIARGALSEVEGYERVLLDTDEGLEVHGDVVADLTHLLAELVENALAFSPPETAVEVIARKNAGGSEIIVADRGVGMTDDTVGSQRTNGSAPQRTTPKHRRSSSGMTWSAGSPPVTASSSNSPTANRAARLPPCTFRRAPSSRVPTSSSRSSRTPWRRRTRHRHDVDPPSSCRSSCQSPRRRGAAVGRDHRRTADTHSRNGSDPPHRRLAAPVAFADPPTPEPAPHGLDAIPRSPAPAPVAACTDAARDRAARPRPSSDRPAVAAGARADADLRTIPTHRGAQPSPNVDVTPDPGRQPAVPHRRASEVTLHEPAPRPAPATPPIQREQTLADLAVAPTSAAPMSASVPVGLAAPSAATTRPVITPNEELASAQTSANEAVGAALSVFGAERRTPGANLPNTSLVSSLSGVMSLDSIVADTRRIPGETPPAPQAADPDEIRFQLAGFQSGTRRADQEE